MAILGVLIVCAYVLFRVLWAVRHHARRGQRLSLWLIIPFGLLILWTLGMLIVELLHHQAVVSTSSQPPS